MKTLLFALIAAGSLSACVVEPAHVRVRAPVVLEPAVVQPAYGGGFCPPGQAMKGRC
ncbi:putative periplasmic lipoprotein [Pseudogulbenkiania ferrooxidans]|uniref:Vir-repressed protein n=1 Tax=Pseudogulbenkiania ferrooxidans 2002 TaxID=279714 RepID=B9YY29_9NEIS|nr:hypothetical protein [Pseudogulbenkiania ferrooxidans]EEG10034.1 vir-repressed protein [Pseudogulbenkiania ferrooxidans 2002]